jgi:preprotein translocase SecE subunit
MANDTKVRRIKATEAEIVERPKGSRKAVVASKATESKAGLLRRLKPPRNDKGGKKPRNDRGKKSKKSKLTAPKWLAATGRFFGKMFGPMGRYVSGSYQELRETKWPNRRATWGLTLAVIVFSIFFAALILSFDNLFKWLLEITLNLGGN